MLSVELSCRFSPNTQPHGRRVDAVARSTKIITRRHWPGWRWRRSVDQQVWAPPKGSSLTCEACPPGLASIGRFRGSRQMIRPVALPGPAVFRRQHRRAAPEAQPPPGPRPARCHVPSTSVSTGVRLAGRLIQLPRLSLPAKVRKVSRKKPPTFCCETSRSR